MSNKNYMMKTEKTEQTTEEEEVQHETEEMRNEQEPTVETLKTENEDLKNSIRMRDARDTMMEELSEANARVPELLFNSVKESLQFDDDGKLVNPKALVEKLKTEFPAMFGFDRQTETIDGGASSRVTQLTRESLSKMTPAEIAALDWSAVRQVLEN